MKSKILVLLAALLGLGLAMNSASARDDFDGIIESKPAGGGAGAWVIGGRTIYVTEQTDLDISDGPLDVGACVEVDIKDGYVVEIDRERNGDCD